MRVLMTGCKEWPYGYSLGREESIGGGTGRYITNLCRGLSSKEVMIDLVTRKFNGQKTTEEVDGLAVHRVRFIKGFYTRLPSFALFSLFRCLSVGKKADMVHGHGLFGSLVAVVSSKISGKPCVVTPHGLSSIETRKVGKKLANAIRRVEKWVYTRAGMVVFLSANERDNFLESIQIDAGRFRIIESATEIPPDQATPPNGNGGKIIVLYMGRVVSGKGLEETVKSFKLLPKEVRENVSFVIVGDGYLRQPLEALAKKLGIEKNIKFTGFERNPARYYKEADIFLLPSSHEGFPLSLLEAMSYGLPCIINDFGVPIPRDVILVMPDNSPETIAEYVQRLVKNRDYREMLGSKARRLVINRYSFERVTNEYLGMYKDMLNGETSA